MCARIRPLGRAMTIWHGILRLGVLGAEEALRLRGRHRATTRRTVQVDGWARALSLRHVSSRRYQLVTTTFGTEFDAPVQKRNLGQPTTWHDASV